MLTEENIMQNYDIILRKTNETLLKEVKPFNKLKINISSGAI